MKFLTGFALILLIHSSVAQGVSVGIRVTDEHSDPLIGATVIFGKKIGAVTDVSGGAEVNLAKGEWSVNVSFLGFGSHEQSYSIQSDTLISIVLFPAEEVLEEVQISGNSVSERLRNMSTGYETFDQKRITKLPYLMGEPDPIKLIQLQPGVSFNVDGNNGYYVRGGGIDQNIVLFDNMELYNINHLFGFFSIFNPDIIERVDFHKSGMSAELGRRLSSVLSVQTRNHLPANEPVYKLGIGTFSFNGLIDQPLNNGKSSIIASARISYLDLITQNLFPQSSEFRQRTDYRFRDYFVKYTNLVNPKNRLEISLFRSTDFYAFEEGLFYNEIGWETSNAGITWKGFVSDRFDFESYLTGGSYQQSFDAHIINNGLTMDSYIRDASHGTRFYASLAPRLQMAFGYEFEYRKVKPSTVGFSTFDSEFILSEFPALNSLERAVYSDLTYSWEKLILSGGLRWSGYTQLGPFQRIVPSNDASPLDTVFYDKMEAIQTYRNMEPRVRINWLVTSGTSFKLSYDRNFQYIHLAPNSSISLPTDIWFPSSELIEPQNSHQFAGKIEQRLPYEHVLAIGAFYKEMNNMVEFENGVIIAYNRGTNFDDNLIFGKGTSRGIEFLLNRTTGKLSGQIAYTLSKTTKQFDEINDGLMFPAKYDRTHDVNIALQYELGKWMFSTLFIFATGNALTLPTSKYLVEGNVVSEYTDRNALRMPDYHRMDVSATFYPKPDRRSSLVFAVYNIYNRSNPYFIYFDVAGNTNNYELSIKLQQVSLFPILPSITYNHFF